MHEWTTDQAQVLQEAAQSNCRRQCLAIRNPEAKKPFSASSQLPCHRYCGTACYAFQRASALSVHTHVKTGLAHHECIGTGNPGKKRTLQVICLQSVPEIPTKSPLSPELALHGRGKNSLMHGWRNHGPASQALFSILHAGTCKENPAMSPARILISMS